MGGTCHDGWVAGYRAKLVLLLARDVVLGR